MRTKENRTLFTNCCSAVVVVVAKKIPFQLLIALNLINFCNNVQKRRDKKVTAPVHTFATAFQNQCLNRSIFFS